MALGTTRIDDNAVVLLNKMSLAEGRRAELEESIPRLGIIRMRIDAMETILRQKRKERARTRLRS